jgi:hypothetical protein
MTNKEIAERLRGEIRHAEKMTGATLGSMWAVADELDPPRPRPGMAVWWRKGDDDQWRLGFANPSGIYRYSTMHSMMFEPFDDIEYKPARILADDEVAVKVPPVSEWPQYAKELFAMYDDDDGVPFTIITRAEAEAREVGDE